MLSRQNGKHGGHDGSGTATQSSAELLLKATVSLTVINDLKWSVMYINENTIIRPEELSARLMSY